MDELKKTILPKNLPKGVIHGDYTTRNILFNNKEISGIIDFDNAVYNNLIYDLAFLLYYWTDFREKGIDFKKFKEIIKIYEKIRPLKQIEKKYLFDQMKMICLIYMAWFFYNGINKKTGKDIFEESKKRLGWLNNVGRENFYKNSF